MRDDGPAVKWYRNRIHQKQRAATTLSIEVGLRAQDKEDTGALAETIDCLDTAIAILEQAKAIGTVTSEVTDEQGGPDPAPRPEALMDDLSHSMAPIDVTFDWHTVVYEDFFG